jgi:hypothetical protein
LILNKGNWNGNQILTDTAYFNQMTNTSQNINLSYGYLWWLNGKTSCMVPESQIVFPFSISPDGPADMIAALGKNGQILNVVPSQNLVFIRMGDMPGTGDVPFTLNNDIWKKLNQIICNTSINDNTKQIAVELFPNPSNGIFTVKINNIEIKNGVFKLYTVNGQEIFEQNLTEQMNYIDASRIEKGFYIAKIYCLNGVSIQKILIN